MAKPPVFPSHPSPNDLHAAITVNRRSSNYFSITTPKKPWAPWYTLPTNQNMETRPCHHTGSRVHNLTCGHTIAVPRDSERCAANCTPSTTTTTTITDIPALSPHSEANRPTLTKICTSIFYALCYRQDMLRETGDPNPQTEFEHHQRLIHQIWNQQDVRLQPAVDLIGGNFACYLCNQPGPRKTRPAYILDQAPYCCVVVGYTDGDCAIIRELDRGILPQPPSGVLHPMHNRGGGGYSRGGRGGGYVHVRSRRDQKKPAQGVKDARITKSRVAEKRTVLSKMREEQMMEGLETLGV
ncbi:hypothetical protein DM02DRAFT_666896 [Periconia macrospinosa]|uniref:Uncharacterized protein n=1 Tax=Periconia macrospinosa TaxID=97972 RepID=A0A2V1ED04_9PLEO|nr:hypothetical protein DM02DRAFT_666896 [Periconia macrospinosa]